MDAFCLPQSVHLKQYVVATKSAALDWFAHVPFALAFSLILEHSRSATRFAAFPLLSSKSFLYQLLKLFARMFKQTFEKICFSCTTTPITVINLDNQLTWVPN